MNGFTVVYLQQDLGHLWDPGHRLDQVDPEEQTRECYHSRMKLNHLLISRCKTFVICTHLFTLVSFAPFLTVLSNLALKQ